MTAIDFDAINRVALNRFESLLEQFLPDGKRCNFEYVARNPRRHDRNVGSFSININTGVWKDFADGDDAAGSDPVSLWAYIFNANQADAARILAGHLGVPELAGANDNPKPAAAVEQDWKPILPVPSDAGSPPDVKWSKVKTPDGDKWEKHPIVARWAYHDADGNVLGYAARVKMPDGTKDVVPQTFCAAPDGSRKWKVKSLPKPRPLYGLHRLAARPDAPVVMFEGEKTADAGAVLIERCVSTTWAGGSDAVRYVDIEPLRGRSVALWPDNDKAGFKAMLAMAQRLNGAAGKVVIVRPPEWADEGWDVADDAPDDWSASSHLKHNTVTPDDFRASLLAANDNTDTGTSTALEAEPLGPLTSWLLTEQKIKVLGRDEKSGLWLIPAGLRDPVHYHAQKLGKKPELLNLMSKMAWEEFIMKSGQGDRFMVDSAVSAIMLAAGENGFWSKPQTTEVDIPRPDNALTGIQAADSSIMARQIGGFTLFDETSQAWYQWHTIWRRVSEEAIRQYVIGEADRWLAQEYENAYVNGTMALMRTRLARLNPIGSRLATDIWEDDRNMLPLRNGVLDLKTKTLSPHSPDLMFNWVIPHNYEPDADCPVTRKFIAHLSGGDGSTELVLWVFLAAVLHGRYDLERYLEFVGMAGTGKSTYISLCKQLVGDENAHSTDMKTLHNNQFETANIYGKRLVMISDADKYGGDVGIFKQMTGRDLIRREEKNKQSQGGFVYKGMVIVAANNPIQFNDSSTAMARRRVPVHIDKKLDKAEVDYRLSEKLSAEMPGLINALLSFSQDEITEVLTDYHGLRRNAANRALVETNAIAAWANEHLIADQRGDSRIGRLGYGYDQYLYPSYAKYCEETGRKGVVSLNTFSRSLIDVLGTVGIEITVKRKNNGAHINGVRLRQGVHDEHIPPLFLSL